MQPRTLAAAIVLGLAATAVAQPIDHLKCYRIKDAVARGYYTTAVDTRDPADFPVEAGCSVRVPASLLCVAARQIVISPAPPGGTSAGQPSQDYLCYKLRCARHQPTLNLADQFGTHQVTVKQSNLYCTPVCSICNGGCADLQNDPANCGVCGNVCAPGVGCSGGSCGGVAPTTTTSTAAPTTTTATTGVPPTTGPSTTSTSSTSQLPTTTTVTTSSSSSSIVPSTMGSTTSTSSTSSTTSTLDCSPLTNCGGVCTDTITVIDCGSCGNVCPGYQQPNDNVTCQNGNTCTYSCQDEHYDVDANPGNGCEVTDPTTGNHTVANAAGATNQNCNDGVMQTITGHLISDTRVHENPAVTGFDATTGSAPDFFVFNATGGLTCQNDIAATLSVPGGGSCYKLTFMTNLGNYTATTSGGTAVINQGSGAYSDNTPMVIEIQKTCSTVVTGDASYSLQFHL